MPDRITRRQFLKNAGGAAAGAALGTIAGTMFAGSAKGANEKVVVGLIGCGGMGMSDVRDFLRTRQVILAAACDVDKERLQNAVRETGGTAAAYDDYRKLLERKDLDAVIIATPDHWHAIPMIHACQVGLDIYVEKPLAHNVAEGRAMVAAARRYGRVVQVGTQQRSGSHFQRAVEIVRSGALGPVSLARAWNVSQEAPDGMGNPPDSDPPPNLDYDFWLGPAPKRPYNPNRSHHSFRWFWEYAGGMMTDWGVHLLDIILWGMNVDYPLALAASGGKYVLRDNRDTPDTMEVIYDCAGFTMVYSLRKACGRGMDDHGYGIQFHGTNGTLFIDRGGFEVFPEGDRMQAIKGDGSDQHYPHVLNFLECLKTRRLPASDIEIAHRSTTTCHLANIALLTGRKLHWDGKNEKFTDDEPANRLLRRTYRPPWDLEIQL
jgi:predicted dehydrogenase